MQDVEVIRLRKLKFSSSDCNQATPAEYFSKFLGLLTTTVRETITKPNQTIQAKAKAKAKASHSYMSILENKIS